MSATDPVVTFVLILVVGIVAGILFDRLAGPSWLARQFAGSTRETAKSISFLPRRLLRQRCW
jgi:hypothetical protein